MTAPVDITPQEDTFQTLTLPFHMLLFKGSLNATSDTGSALSLPYHALFSPRGNV